jgi:hypothetical protein
MISSNIQFLTVPEAQEQTGKSQSTIIRIINEYKGSKHVKKEGKKYLVSSQILSELFTNYSPTIHMNSNSNNDDTKHTESKLFTNYSPTIHLNSLIESKNETIIEILRNELEQKNQIINNQANQISALTESVRESFERIRESNIIIKSFQEQIKLPQQAQTITTIDIKSAKHTNTPLIMDLHSQGMPYSKIAEQLNKRGLKNQYGKEYTRDAIKTTVNRNK